MQYQSFSPVHLASLLGVKKDLIPAFIWQLLQGKDVEYTTLMGPERDGVILDILQTLEADSLSYSGPHRHEDWEQGWNENLIEFIESSYDTKKLVPKYYGKLRPCRYEDSYILGRTGNFMFTVSDAYRRWLFSEFFHGCDTLHEFGCGTGHNLLILAELFPQTRLVGYDWANVSQNILALLRDKVGLNIHGERFDFYNPKQTFDLGENAGVLTFGALEQVYNRFGPFLAHLLASKPKICVHVEGFDEMYAPETNLMDHLALKYHRKRNYLCGYLTALKELELKSKIKIIAERRLRFGNLFDDPYSYLIWKPVL